MLRHRNGFSSPRNVSRTSFVTVLHRFLQSSLLYGIRQQRVNEIAVGLPTFMKFIFFAIIIIVGH